MKVTVKLKYGAFPAQVQFAKYQDNDRTALLFRESDGFGYFDGSVNIGDAFVPNNDFIVVKSYGENEGMDKELIRLGLIEETPITYAASGFIMAPIHKLTDKAIKLRDEQFAEQNI